MNIAKIRQEYERNGKELQHKKLQHPSDIFSEEFTTGISTICPLKSQDVRGNVARKTRKEKCCFYDRYSFSSDEFTTGIATVYPLQLKLTPSIDQARFFL